MMQENFLGVTELHIIGTDLFFAAKIKDSQNAIGDVYGVLKLLRNPEVQMRCDSCIDDGVPLKTHSHLDELIVSDLIITPMVNGEFGLNASDEVLVFYPEKEVWIQTLLSRRGFAMGEIITKETKTVVIPEDDLYILLLNNIRYAIVKKTTVVVDEAIDEACRCMSQMTTSRKIKLAKQLIFNIESAWLDLYKEDYDIWLEFLEYLKKCVEEKK